MKEITIMVPINAQAHSLHQPALTSLQISERIPPKPVYSRTGPSVSLIAIAVSPRDISMSLSKRLQQMQDKSQLTKPDFSGLSLDEMDQMKIAFGRQQLGKPFKEVWDREQSWVTWFTQHYENSQKYEHQIFLHYIEKRVERAEVTQQAIPVTNVHPKIKIPVPGTTKSRAMPKSFAMPKCKNMVRPPASQEIHHEFDYDLDPDNFEVIPELEDVASQNLPEENNPHVLAMEQRLYQMENVMARVIQHLESQAQMPEAVDQ